MTMTTVILKKKKKKGPKHLKETDVCGKFYEIAK